MFTFMCTVQFIILCVGCFWLQRSVYYERVCHPSLKPDHNAIESGSKEKLPFVKQLPLE